MYISELDVFSQLSTACIYVIPIDNDESQRPHSDQLKRYQSIRNLEHAQQLKFENIHTSHINTTDASALTTHNCM